MRAHTHADTHARGQAARRSPRLRRGFAARGQHLATMSTWLAAFMLLDDTQQVAKLRHGHQCTLKVPAKLQIVAKKFARLKNAAYICRQI